MIACHRSCPSLTLQKHNLKMHIRVQCILVQGQHHNWDLAAGLSPYPAAAPSAMPSGAPVLDRTSTEGPASYANLPQWELDESAGSTPKVCLGLEASQPDSLAGADVAAGQLLLQANEARMQDVSSRHSSGAASAARAPSLPIPVRQVRNGSTRDAVVSHV